MKIIDRYLLKEFLRAFTGIVLFFALVMLLREMLGDLNNFLEEDPPLLQVVVYFLSTLPREMVEVLPVSVILAMLFSVGNMARNKELLAIHAGGVSYWRCARPLLALCLLASVAVFLINELVVPRSEARRLYIEQVVIKGKKESVLTVNKNITTKGKGNRFYTMKSFDSGAKVMLQPLVTDVAEDFTTKKMSIEAESARLVTREAEDEDGEERQYWRFHNAVRLTFDETGALLRREFFREIELPMEEDLDRFLASNKKAEDMNFWELSDKIRIQSERDLDVDKLRDWRIILHQKMAFPLAAFLLGMIGYTFAVRAAIHSLVLQFGLALTAVVVYYAMVAVSERLSNTPVVPVMLAAWFPNVLFAGYLALRFHDLEKVPSR